MEEQILTIEFVRKQLIEADIAGYGSALKDVIGYLEEVKTVKIKFKPTWDKFYDDHELNNLCLLVEEKINYFFRG